MRRFCQTVLLGLLSVAMPLARASEILDRVVATVNAHPILQSDVQESLAFEALANGQTPHRETTEQLQAELDRLIDQQLLRDQMLRVDQEPPSREQLDQRIREIRKLHPGAETEAGWLAVMARYGLSQKQVEARVADQILVARLIDTRLSPGIQVGPRSIETYYRDTLLPKVTKAGGKVPSLEQVTPQIREIILQNRVNDALTAWLQALRAEGRVRKLEAQNPSGGPAQ